MLEWSCKAEEDSQQDKISEHRAHKEASKASEGIKQNRPQKGKEPIPLGGFWSEKWGNPWEPRNREWDAADKTNPEAHARQEKEDHPMFEGEYFQC